MKERKRPKTSGEDDAEADSSPEASPAANAPAAKELIEVYRVLRLDEITSALRGKEVHSFWPQHDLWYRATVKEISVDKQKAMLFYPGGEQESLELAEMIEAKHIAVVEHRAVTAEPFPGELEVSDAQRAVPDAPAEEDSEGEEDDEGEEEDDDEDQMSDDSEARVLQKIRNRRAAQADGFTFELADSSAPRGSSVRVSARMAAAAAPMAPNVRQYQSSRPAQQPQQQQQHHRHHQAAAAGAAHPGAAPLGATEAEDEAYKTALLGAIMGQLQPAGAGRAGTPLGGAGRVPPMRAPSGASPHGGSAGGSGSGPSVRRTSLTSAARPALSRRPSISQVDVRKKATEQLTAALVLAAEELAGEGYQDALPEAAAVAKHVEAELYKLTDNDSGAMYRAKFRSLVFNLRDAANKGLRSRVLRGELTPTALVRLDAAELASRELSDWRKAKAEELYKNAFLDEEVAAKYSTAAAAALGTSQRDRKDAAAAGPSRSPSPPPLPTASPARGVTSSVLGADPHGSGHLHLAGHPEDVPPGLHQGEAEEAGPRTSSPHAAAAAAPAPPVIHSVVDYSAIRAATQQADLLVPAPAPPHRTVLKASSPRDAAGALHPAPTTAPHAKHSRTGSGSRQHDPTSGASDQTADGGGGAAAAAAHRGVGSSGVKEEAGTAAGTGGAAGGSDDMDLDEAAAPVPEPVVLDLAPLVSRPEEAGANHRHFWKPGDQVWEGKLVVPGAGSFSGRVTYLAGMGQLSEMLNAQQPAASGGALEVKGRVPVEKMDSFLEELRKSRNRTVTIGFVSLRPEAPPSEQGVFSEQRLVYASKSRAGVIIPGDGLEGYLIAKGPLAARLLKTARLVCAAHSAHLMPANASEDQLLLFIIHRKDWRGPPSSAPVAAPHPHIASHHSGHPSHHAGHSKPHHQHQPAADHTSTLPASHSQPSGAFAAASGAFGAAAGGGAFGGAAAVKAEPGFYPPAAASIPLLTLTPSETMMSPRTWAQAPPAAAPVGADGGGDPRLRFARPASRVEASPPPPPMVRREPPPVEAAQAAVQLPEGLLLDDLNALALSLGMFSALPGMGDAPLSGPAAAPQAAQLPPYQTQEAPQPFQLPQQQQQQQAPSLGQQQYMTQDAQAFLPPPPAHQLQFQPGPQQLFEPPPQAPPFQPYQPDFQQQQQAPPAFIPPPQHQQQPQWQPAGQMPPPLQPPPLAADGTPMVRLVDGRLIPLADAIASGLAIPAGAPPQTAPPPSPPRGFDAGGGAQPMPAFVNLVMPDGTQVLIRGESHAFLQHCNGLVATLAEQPPLPLGARLQAAPPPGPCGPMVRETPPGPYGVPPDPAGTAGPYPELYDADFYEGLAAYEEERLDREEHLMRPPGGDGAGPPHRPPGPDPWDPHFHHAGGVPPPQSWPSEHPPYRDDPHRPQHAMGPPGLPPPHYDGQPYDPRYDQHRPEHPHAFRGPPRGDWHGGWEERGAPGWAPRDEGAPGPRHGGGPRRKGDHAAAAAPGGGAEPRERSRERAARPAAASPQRAVKRTGTTMRAMRADRK